MSSFPRSARLLRHRLAFALSAALATGIVAAQSAPVVIPPAAVAHPDLWPAMTSPIPRDARVEARIRDLLKSMSVEEKVGQVIQGDLGSLTPNDVRTYHLGSVLGGGNSDPGAKYNAPAKDWLALADALHDASVDKSKGGHGIPVLLGIDAVHGHNNVVGATLFPHNIALGAMNDPALVHRIAQVTAEELRATGFEWTFAPTVTVPRDDRWGRTYEGYSEDPALVSRYATAVVEGLQGRVGTKDFLDARHVVASSKHYLGDGGTFDGKDKGDARVSETELRDIHGAGHIAALKAGTQTVMASFSSWNGGKMHGNRTLLTDLLKQRMGFDGFVVGDWNGHADVPGCTPTDCPTALLAGVDMYMAPDSWKGLYETTVKQVRDGTIPMQRLDDAVSRILRVKLRMGLFDAPKPSQRVLGGHFEQLGSADHRALAREAVRKSLVLLKNDGGVLPLKPNARVLVAGDGADDVGKQAGGWTLSWQGSGTERADFPNAQSIWDGIRETTAKAGGHAERLVDAKYTAKPDVAIVVFGEDPYAEFLGDIPSLAYRHNRGHDLEMLRRLKADGIPVVAVFLSGRPLWMNRELNASDAFVAAWLPGSEGGGISDVLFADASGKPRYDFTGRLSFSWPRTAVQTPLNAGQSGYDPQFPLGYGLSYASAKTVGMLSEESGLGNADADPAVFFERGAVAPGWTLRVADAKGDAKTVRTLPTRDLAKNIAVSATDHRAQEDARRIEWRGPAQVWLQSDAPIDLSRESMAGASLVVTMRVDAPVRGDVDISMGCGANCRGHVPLTATLAEIPTGKWTRVAVPLVCFAKGGTDLTKVDDVFHVAADAGVGVTFSQIELGTQADHAVQCNMH
ncbi:glycoside hydrolase family 3 protein [Cognatilysobacter terrigena]|uniref:glycoside hydrolase family 3 protein n=1 Tax=Cognatilysobacter terrigena TaxID=2488749 RepID=UPI00105BEC3E|nr:exo 1,3/1,4-beta-D-glucan glucohydrolase [Lysobacter terrigena]